MAKNIKKEELTVGDLVPASYNPRKITDKQLGMLKKSMAESGVVVNVRTGRIIGGHQRTKNLDKSWPIIKQPHADKVGTVALGYIETSAGRWQYREVDWPEKKEAAANVSANKQGGEFDLPLLKEIILTLDDGAFDMELTGFNSHELELMMTAVHQEDQQSIISKNFNRGKGEEENEQKEFVPGKYPVTFIFDQTEWEAWEAVKDKLKVKDDKTALLKIIGGKHA
jgi:hypothetical protein